MHNVLALRYPVRVLKCRPLHPILNRSRYAYRDIRFYAESTVPVAYYIFTASGMVYRICLAAS